MPPTSLDRSVAAEPVLRFDHVSKVFCDSLVLARKYAMRDMVRPRHDRLSELRPGEWVGLRGVSFELQAGKTLLVLGTAGSGKTTLGDLISGQRTADAGTIVRRGTVGLLGGGKYGQNPFMRLREYVRLMAALQGVGAADLDRTCETILEWADLGAHRDTMVFDLPKSLLGPLPLIGSLLVERDIYVFDDYAPVDESALDQRIVTRLNETLATRTSVVLSRGPHTPSHVDEVLILHGGEIIYAGDPNTALAVYERFARHVRLGRERSGPGADGVRASLRQPIPTVAEATTLVSDILRGEGRLDAALDRDLARLAALKRPVIIGPCLSAVSWEVLFWLPFVKWARRQTGDAFPSAAVARGAVGSWYARTADTFVDVYDLMPIPEFMRRNRERVREASTSKQTRISTFDRELIQLAASRCTFSDVECLHPSQLLGLSAQVWRGRMRLVELTSRAVYERLPSSGEPAPNMPEKYVAVCFRFTTQFPDSPENRAFVTDAIRSGSERLPVVILGNASWKSLAPSGATHEILVVDSDSDPRHTNTMQANIVGHAQAVIGTLNGAVTLAPFQGVPAMCLHAPTGGFLDFQTGTLRHAAEQLSSALVMGAIGTVSPKDMARWLDDVLEGRASIHAGTNRF